MKQTAVEYLFHKLWDTPKDKLNWYAILKEAKEIEKEEMLNLIRFMRLNDKMSKSVEDLYQEFKKTYAE